jgi:predicted dehydrogenase
MTLRLGIVGAGVMGEKVAHAAAGLDGVVVTAVVDPNASRASALAGPTSATFHDLPALLEAGIVDAVYVGVPHDLHESACVAALNAGLHLLVDKPLCNELVEAEAILAARDAVGAMAMVGFSYRFRAEWRTAREWIADGLIGAPSLVSDTIIEAQSRTPAWYWDAAAGGGVLQLQSHHSFDRIRWLLDDSFVAVSCRTLPEREAEHTASISAATVGGILAGIDLGLRRGYDGTSQATTVIQGSRGHLVIDSAARAALLISGDRRESFESPDDDWMRTELEAFVGACAVGATTTSTLDDGVHALRCALAARESARDSGAWRQV